MTGVTGHSLVGLPAGACAGACGVLNTGKPVTTCHCICIDFSLVTSFSKVPYARTRVEPSPENRSLLVTGGSDRLGLNRSLNRSLSGNRSLLTGQARLDSLALVRFVLR